NHASVALAQRCANATGKTRVLLINIRLTPRTGEAHALADERRQVRVELGIREADSVRDLLRQVGHDIAEVRPVVIGDACQTEGFGRNTDRIERRAEGDRSWERDLVALVIAAVAEESDVELAQTATRHVRRDGVHRRRDLANLGAVTLGA